MMSLLRRWQTETGDAYVVSLVRVILGILLLVSAVRELVELFQAPYRGDVFHLPLVPEAIVPSRAAFLALVIVECALAALVIVGWLARPALLASAISGIYLLLCDRLAYHNNRYALLLFAWLIAFAPCDRAFVWRGRGAADSDRIGPLWAQRLAQVQLSIIYLASGCSKLLDPDWRGGLVVGDRLVRSTALAIDRGVPPAIMELLARPAFASGVSKLAIATELFLAVALFLPSTRSFALWWGVMFHVTIELTSKVELFGWLSIAIYALFARPALRERAIVYDPDDPWAVWLARLVHWFDWLARFDVRPQKNVAGGVLLGVIERDGSLASGLRGFARITRATPILFALSVPLSLVASVRARRGLRS